jgi:Domain of unknown function (DUF4166)
MLFQAALRERWHELPASVRRLHSGAQRERFSGRVTVTRGRGPMAGLACRLFGFPPAAEDVPLTLTITRSAEGEYWERNFGGTMLRSTLSASSRPYHYNERIWLFTSEQELPIKDGSLWFPARRGWFLGLPVPALFLPRSESREYDVNGVFQFDIGVRAPLGAGLIVRYRGYVEPDGAPEA